MLHSKLKNRSNFHQFDLHRKASGVTLIELVIVISIIGILAAIAIPSYNNQMMKGNRSAAQQALLDIANRQQQYFLDSRIFAADLATLNYTVDDDVSRHYTITVSADNTATPPIFTLTATPDTGTSQSTDGALTINHLGVKTPSDKW
ncbi:MAG: type IV pilin protein [Reinekea sp.]|jgi:type IV pilus assembly protein PilE